MQAVQSELKIRERYLEALEENDFTAIPGEVYARGFLRSYAKFLDLDPEELLGAMPHTVYSSEDDDATPAERPRPDAFAPVRAPRPARRTAGPTPIVQRRPRHWPWVVLPLLFIAGFLYVLGSSHLFTQGNPSPPSRHHQGGSGSLAKGKGKGHKKGSGGGSSQGTGQTATTLTPAPSSTGPDGGTEVNYTVASGPISVQVTTTGNCWLYVATDSTITVQQVLPAGTYNYTAQTGVVLKVGLPSVAKVVIDGNTMPVQGTSPQSIGVTVAGG